MTAYIEQGNLDWMKIAAPVLTEITEDIEIYFDPPEDEIGNKYNLRLIISDLTWINRTETEYSIVLEIVDLAKVKTVTLEKDEEDIQEAQPKIPTEYGVVEI